jgi:hypothetical protein
MPRLAATLVLAALALAAPGCRRGGGSGPEATYRAFAAAARAGDAARAWPLLSARSRAAFDERAKALAARVQGAPASGRELLLGDLAAGAPRIAKVVVLRESADAAVLGVTVEGSDRQEEVSLVREDDAWRVVAPEGAAP